MFTTGVALWLVYGVLLSSWPIIIANAITALLAGIALLMSKQNAPTHKHVIEQNQALTST